MCAHCLSLLCALVLAHCLSVCTHWICCCVLSCLLIVCPQVNEMGMMEQEAAGNLVVPEWAHQIQAPAGWTCQWLKCTGCDRDEAAVTHLTSHVQTMVTESTECKLNTCLGLHREADRKHLELHLENCTFGNGASTRCTWEGTCTRRFTAFNKYREHLETHMLLDRTRFQCLWKDCISSGFATAQELLRHILHFHISGAAQPVVPAISCRWQDCQFKLEVSEAETATDEMAKLQEHVMSAHADWDPQLPERVLVCRWGNCRRFFNTLMTRPSSRTTRVCTLE